MKKRWAATSGFTLIELLVAMAIVAVVGAMAFGGINLVIDQRELARERVSRWREIQLAMRLVVQDHVGAMGRWRRIPLPSG